MIVGRIEKAGASAHTATFKLIVGAKTTMPDSGAYVTGLSALLDGEGPGSGEQRIRGGLWATDGTLLAATEEILVSDETPLGWLDLDFAEGISSWGEGEEAIIGLYFDDPEVARWYGTGTSGLEDPQASYTDPPPNLTAPAEGKPAPLLVAAYVIDTGLVDEEDPWYARLGFDSAQAQFSGTGPQAATRQRATAGWHGTWLDVEPQGASFAIVDRAGPLADLVGERVRITHDRYVAYAYVHRSTDLDDERVDLSLTRRVFSALAPLNTETLAVKVEAMN